MEGLKVVCMALFIAVLATGFIALAAASIIGILGLNEHKSTKPEDKEID
jgi:hypothetical protein